MRRTIYYKVEHKPSGPPHIGHRKIGGLGDLVAVIAQPLAKASDRLFGTRLYGCQPCQRRREALNTLPARLKRWLGAIPRKTKSL